MFTKVSRKNLFHIMAFGGRIGPNPHGPWRILIFNRNVRQGFAKGGIGY
jgi:hypothetical protein